MTTYYVSPSGSDSNNGLGPDASHASNKPYLTIGKALVSGSAVTPGDIVVVAPGYYYGAGNHTVLGSISSTGSPTQIDGDPTNAYGFKDGSGVRLAPGIPWITTRTSGEGLDSPIASTNNMFNCTANDPSGLQFSNLLLEVLTTTGAIWNCDANAGAQNTFTDCILIAFNVVNFSAGTAATAARNHAIRRNTIICSNVINCASTAAAATADADLGIVVEENMVFGKPYGATYAASASGGNLAGGLSYKNNIFFLLGGNAATVAGKVSTVTPITFTGNQFWGTGAILGAGTSGQVIDGGYNRIWNMSSTASYSNVTQAGTSFIGVAPNHVLPHLTKWGLELPRSDFFGWTDAAHTNQKFSASALVSADFRGRTIRPWGAGASIGCFQAQAAAQDATSAITGGGANSLKLTGAGEVSLFVPVDDAAFTLSIITKSGSYGGSNYPQMIVVANPGIGVASDTTVTASDGSEQTITTGTITPTAKGVMEVRLISRSTSVSSTTNFDRLTKN